MTVLAVVTGGIAIAATPALALDGTVWLTAARSGVVSIASCGPARVCGTITRVLTEGQANALDANNPDRALRTRPVRGLRILDGFTRNPNGRWTGGRIYDPETGRTYRSELRLLANGNLEVKGCLGPICQTQIWTPSR
ncbi:MAG: DUF2147 domain-containing protein [Hyphomonadaceae bacterium]|jgi:uncharacterized protein (DUF2147 family)|nr:DUF2147 domain-containing protein [Hyphomonadaceae bacterium]